MYNKVIRFASVFLLSTSIHAASLAFAAQPGSPVQQQTARVGETEIEGTLTSRQGTTMVVAGISIDVSRAEIQRGIVVGDWVKVHATRNASGTWVAREVELDTRDDDDAEAGHLELYGTVEALSAASITVSGMTFALNGTEFQGSIAVGSSVKVEFTLVNGQAVAREVKQVVPGEDDDSTDDRGGRGSDDRGSDDRGGRGSDDRGSDDRGGRGSDDRGTDDRGGRGSDDGGSDDSGSDDSGSDDGSSDDSSSDDGGSDDSGSDDDDGDDDNGDSDDGGSDDNDGNDDDDD